MELQSALNRAWEVEPDPEQGGIRSFLLTRVLSFGMVLAIAFLLVVSLAASALLIAFGDALGAMVPGGVSDILLQVLTFLVSFAVITLLFAAMFKFIPDAEVAWRDVWVGALGTAFLFTVGKFLIGFYLGQSDPGQAYGAAGSLAIILVWIYYSALILFLGAEFIKAWAQRYGTGIEPARGRCGWSRRSDTCVSPRRSTNDLPLRSLLGPPARRRWRVGRSPAAVANRGRSRYYPPQASRDAAVRAPQTEPRGSKRPPWRGASPVSRWGRGRSPATVLPREGYESTHRHSVRYPFHPRARAPA